MKQMVTRTQQRNHLAHTFDRLCDTDQEYLETLTTQLAEIHETAPEKQVLTGKNLKNKVQLNKEQKG
jgi:hypothetical protein